MSGSALRAASLCALLACAALAGQQAAAQQLPEHVRVAGFGPNAAEIPDEVPFTDVEFGRAVAIRNGHAFVGVPGTPDGGHVAVLDLTASGWKRVGTLKLPSPLLDERFGNTLAFR